ncbi:hypothetical protein PAJ34TS1_51690 [Paenibacillus azoreducens]
MARRILDKCLKTHMTEVTCKMEGDPSPKLKSNSTQSHRTEISLLAQGSFSLTLSNGFPV